jgi:hypothetical protein
MSTLGAPGRADIVAMLAEFGDRAPQDVPDRIGSLELTWLITCVEQRYQVTLDLGEDELARMTTVDGVVAALRDALAGAGHG